MISRIDVTPLFYSKISEEEKMSYALKCKFLEKLFRSRFEAPQHIVVDAIYRMECMRPTLNDLIIRCRADQKLEVAFQEWVKRNKAIWRFLVEPNVWSKADLSLYVKDVAELKATAFNGYQVENLLEKTKVEYETFEEAIVDFKQLFGYKD